MNTNYEQYKTPDLALAATLTVYGFFVISLDRSNPRRVAFEFANSDALQTTVTDYWSSSLQVSPKVYFDALKHLKTRLYSEGL